MLVILVMFVIVMVVFVCDVCAVSHIAFEPGRVEWQIEIKVGKSVGIEI